jgi:peroxiredoxin
MRKLFIVLLSVLVACSGNNTEVQEGGVTITGKVNYPLSGIITLELLEGNAVTVKDTIELLKDNTFTHFVSNSEPLIYRLNFYDRQAVNLIVDKDDIDVHVDGNNQKGLSRVEGSEDMEYLNEVSEMVHKFQEKMGPLNQRFVKVRDSGNLDDLKTIQDEMEVARKEAVDNVKAKINEMGISIAALFSANYIVSDDNFEFLDELAMKFNRELPNSIYTKDFVKRINEMRKLAIGQIAPDFTLPNPDGEMISLSSFRGSYLLVDFWAKWCKPCRLENPNIVRAYNKFHDKGFEILGVSLDRNRADWLKAIKEDGLTWTHVSDLKFWQSEVVPLYSIKGIPFAVLLDPEGKIIAKNLRGSALEKKLEEIYQ